MMFWVPQSGDIGMGVSILSYNGGVQFGLVTDRSFVPDPRNIVSGFLPEFERMLLAVLQCPRDVPLDPAIAEQRIFSRQSAPVRSPEGQPSIKTSESLSEGRSRAAQPECARLLIAWEPDGTPSARRAKWAPPFISRARLIHCQC